MQLKHEMVAGRSCNSQQSGPKRSNSSSIIGGATANDDGRHNTTNTTTITTATTATAASTVVGSARVMPPRRIMCRCCLSEQLEQPALAQLATLEDSGDGCENWQEPATMAGYVSLDTLALVDLRTDEDRHFGREAAAMTLLDCLNACADIGASAADVQLPQHICLDCCHTLETCCEFIRCVRNADKILRRRCMAPRKREQRERWRNGRKRAKGSELKEEQHGKRLNLIGQGEQSVAVAVDSAVCESTDEEEVISSISTTVAVFNQRSVTKNAKIATNEAAKDLVAKCQNASFKKLISKSCDKLCNAPLPEVNVTSSPTLSKTERSPLRSLDSGIEIDEDLSLTKPTAGNTAETAIQCHYEQYDGYTFVVLSALSADLQRFHRSNRKTAVETFKCGFCIFECNTKNDLQKHKQIHLGPPQYSCRICQFACHFKYALLRHMEAMHSSVCDLDVEVAHINAGHNVQATAINGYSLIPTEYHCQLCRQYLISCDALEQHLKSHKVYCQCTVCDFKSSTRESVLEHLAEVHKLLVDRRIAVKYIPLRRRNSVDTKETNNTPPTIKVATKPALTSTPIFSHATKDNKHRKHLCQYCGKCFERRFHLLKHEYKVHRLDVDAMDTLKQKILHGNSTKHVQLKYLRQRKAAQIEQAASKFQCEICAAVFLFNFELKYHMRTHKPTTACNQQKLMNSATDNASDKTSIAFGYAQAVSEAIMECRNSDEQLPSEQINLLELVTQPSSMDSLDASPSSSNHSGDINYDDQLYLNEFDLGLLDCSEGFGGF